VLAKMLRAFMPAKWQRNLVYFRDLAERMDLIELAGDRAAQGLATLALTSKPTERPDGDLEKWEFRLRSQGGEDGILHHIFECVGVTNRTFVEFGIQAGRECNAAHLALSEGWHGLFIEGDRRLAAWAQEYYERMLGPDADRIKVGCAFLTVENVNSVLSENGMTGPIDLLSIDLDGNDYWIWEAVAAVTPRVVVIEYNAVFGAERALTIPYDPRFRWSGSDNYFGASLAALTKLGGRKGYALVGCGSNGVNAFFVQRGLAGGGLREVPVSDAFRVRAGLTRKRTLDQQFDLVRSLPLVNV